MITSLEAGVKYRLRITAILGSRKSEFFDLPFATDAVEMPFDLPGSPNIVATYTGNLLTDLTPNDPTSEVRFRGNEGTWLYTGPVTNGQLTGVGQLSYSLDDASVAPCVSPEFNTGLFQKNDCSSVCDRAEFFENRLVAAQCELVHYEGGTNDTDLKVISLYVGEIIGAEGISQSNIGPFSYIREGEGKLIEYLDQGDFIRVGSWSNDVLEGVGGQMFSSGEFHEGTFSRGTLLSGQIYDRPLNDAILSYEVIDGAPFGGVIGFTEDSFYFGTGRGSAFKSYLANGFYGFFESGSFRLTEDLNHSPPNFLTVPKIHSQSYQCKYHENFGRVVDPSERFFNRGQDVWRGIGLHFADYEIDLKTPILSSHIWKESGLNASDPTHSRGVISLDGRQFIPTLPMRNLLDRRAPLLLASSCNASEIELPHGTPVRENQNFCESLAIAISRAYYCSSDTIELPEDLSMELSAGNWRWRIFRFPDGGGDLTPNYGYADLENKEGEDSVKLRLFCQYQAAPYSAGIAIWDSQRPRVSIGETMILKIKSEGKELEFLVQMNRFGLLEPTNSERARFWEMLLAEQEFQIFLSIEQDEDILYSFNSSGVREMASAMQEVCSGLRI